MFFSLLTFLHPQNHSRFFRQSEKRSSVHLSDQSSKIRLQSMICSNISKSRSQMSWQTAPLKIMTKLKAFRLKVKENRQFKIQTLSGQWQQKHSAHQLRDLSKFTNVKINLYLCCYIPRPSVVFRLSPLRALGSKQHITSGFHIIYSTLY